MSRRTHCGKRIHHWTLENTYLSSDGKRRCRLCSRTAQRRYYRANRERLCASQRERKRRRYVPKVRDRQEHLATLAKARAARRDSVVPSAKVLPFIEWMVERWGIVQTARVLKVSHQTIYNIRDGRNASRRTAEQVVNVMRYQAAQAEIRAGRVAA